MCKYLVPEGYPMSKPVTARVSIDERVLAEEGTRMVYAGAEAVGGKIQSTGSRFAAVLAIRPQMVEAEAAVERTLERLQLDGVWHRRDIATAALLQKRVDHMYQVHGSK